jgi:hypothetical protein
VNTSGQIKPTAILLVFVSIAALTVVYLTLTAEADSQNEKPEVEKVITIADSPPPPAVELVDFNYRITVRTEMWWRFAYVVHLRNNSDEVKTVDIAIKYVDEGGTPIDSVMDAGVAVQPGEERIRRGHSLLSMPGAETVKDAKLSLNTNNARE